MVGEARIEITNRSLGKVSIPTLRRAAGETEEHFQQRLRPKATLAEAQAALARSANVHDVRADRTVHPADGYPGEDWITKEDCRTDYANKTFDGYWYYKNHYSPCLVATGVFDSILCDANNYCRTVGRTTARMTIVGRGFHSNRYIDWDIYFDKFRLEFGREYGYLRFNVNMACETFEDDRGQCTEDPPNGVMRSLAEWRANGWAYFHTVTSTGQQAPDWPYEQEKRALFKYTPSITAFESGSYWPSDAWIIGRCDNASYITNGGCMFPGTPGVFHLDYNEPSYKESVEFVYNAMFHLDTVMPDSVGLYVPGGYYRQPLANDAYVPLHRNYYGNRSRSKVRAKCIELYGQNYTQRPDGQTNQCDEYPFSASYENANYDDTGTAATWAVKPVLDIHNSKSGNALNIFYLYDHILDGDQYYVKIDNAPAA